MNVSRDRDGHDFTSGETRDLQHLAPHLRRAFQIQQRMSLANAEHGALDTLPWGVLFVDAGGRVLSYNCSAAKLLAQQDGLNDRRWAQLNIIEVTASQGQKFQLMIWAGNPLARAATFDVVVQPVSGEALPARERLRRIVSLRVV